MTFARDLIQELKTITDKISPKYMQRNMQQITEEHPCRSTISIKLLALRHGCSPVNLLHIFKTPFVKNTSGELLL